jgi:hypothetical protein
MNIHCKHLSQQVLDILRINFFFSEFGQLCCSRRTVAATMVNLKMIHFHTIHAGADIVYLEQNLL